MKALEQLKELLNGDSKNVLIFPHQKPDADALGSALALTMYLEKKGHSARVLSPTPYPAFLNWMPASDRISEFDKCSEEEVKNLFSDSDIFICLDFSAPHRMSPLDGFLSPYLNDRQGKTILLIDHHRGKEDFADLEFWDIDAAASAELIYRIITEAGDKALLDKEIAECIYAGIMTDTGSFKHPSTSSSIHRIAADLIDLGMDNSKVHRLVYDANSESKVRFLGHALLNKLKVIPEYRTAYFPISNEELKNFNFRTGDTEGLVNYGLSITGVSLAATLIDYKTEIRMSFRSAGNFSVADFARNHFNGGGHKNAAGGRIAGASLEEVKNRFEELLSEYKTDLLSSEE